MTIEIDHTSLSVSDYDKAKRFYAAALKPLGVAIQMEFPMDDGTGAAGLGTVGKPFLWLSGGGKTTPHVHIAFRAEDRAQVDAFYTAAMAAGGTDNGPPGLRPHYHQHYYAAFVLDPDGHNIEAVTHAPARAAASRKPARKTAKKATAKKATAKKKPAAKRKPAKGKRK